MFVFTGDADALVEWLQDPFDLYVLPPYLPDFPEPSYLIVKVGQPWSPLEVREGDSFTTADGEVVRA